MQEARQRRLLELKNAMDEAHYNAQQEKHIKRMQHLQQGGHDIKRLQATIEGMYASSNNSVFQSTCVTTFSMFSLS